MHLAHRMKSGDDKQMGHRDLKLNSMKRILKSDSAFNFIVDKKTFNAFLNWHISHLYIHVQYLCIMRGKIPWGRRYFERIFY